MAEGGVMMKAAPVASFKMAQTKFLFEFLIIALDEPALFAPVATSWRRGMDSGRFDSQYLVGSFSVLGPFDQQPLLGMRFAAPVVAMSDTHAQAGKTRVHGAARAFAPD